MGGNGDGMYGFPDAPADDVVHGTRSEWIWRQAPLRGRRLRVVLLG